MVYADGDAKRSQGCDDTARQRPLGQKIGRKAVANPFVAAVKHGAVLPAGDRWQLLFPTGFSNPTLD
jgi:hypothetical protein